MTINAYLADELWQENQIINNGVLLENNGLIEAILTLDEFKNHLEYGSLPLTHFKNSALFPGLVNTHTHSFQSLLKGVADDCDFFTWRENALYKFSRNITEEELYTGALFAFSEMLLNGITTVCDFFYIHNKSTKNDRAIIQAAKDLGIRFTLARTFYDWDGAPDNYQESIDLALENTESLISEFNNQTRQTNMVQIIPAPHSLHGASFEMIQTASQLAQKYQLPCHMHIAEGEYERNMMLEKTGKTPMQLLYEWGVMDENLTGIHCVWVDAADQKLMAERNMNVSYNPNSNMFLGDGITPITELLKQNITIGLGTDGGCSNNRSSIIDEMRACALLQKVRHCDGTVVSAEDVIQMATLNGEKILRQKVGQLKPGYCADFIVVDLDDLSMQPKPYWHKQLVYSAQPSAIKQVFINGKCQMQNGELNAMPKHKVVEKIQSVWKRWASL